MYVCMYVLDREYLTAYMSWIFNQIRNLDG